MQSEQEKLGSNLLKMKKAFNSDVKLSEVHDFILNGGIVIATPDVFENNAVSANSKH